MTANSSASSTGERPEDESLSRGHRALRAHIDMDTQELQSGPYCLYPPRLAQEVDITEQIEASVTRYVVRNAANSRYFILKQPEYRVLRQFDGNLTLSDVAGGGPQGDCPRVSLPALVRFVGRLDSLGLLARGGSDDPTAARQRERGLYIRFHFFNPDRFLAWLDRVFGWALTRTSILSSFVLMVFVAFWMLARVDEVSTYTSYLYREYGIAAILAITLTITALHEFAHGLGRKHQRLWVIFAGIYWQLVVSALSGLLWLLATPYTLLSDLSLLVFIGGSFNILINCNPLIKLDGYYALSQALGVVNLQGRSSDYARSLFARLLGEPQTRKADSQRSLLYISYWVCSILYSAILIWLILGWVSGELMDGLRFLGVLLTMLLAALLTERWWKPILTKGRAFLASTVRGNFLKRASITIEGVSTMSAEQVLDKPLSEQESLQ